MAGGDGILVMVLVGIVLVGIEDAVAALLRTIVALFAHLRYERVFFCNAFTIYMLILFICIL